MLTKKECEDIIGKTIRNDTYAILTMMSEQRMTYQDAYREVDTHRSKYRVDKDTRLVTETTIKKYYPKIRKYLGIPRVEEKPYGIYGIYVDNDLIYIGMTMTSFQQRYNEHKNNISHTANINRMPLYAYLAKARDEKKLIELRPLISNNDLKTNQKITRRDWESMELGLITLYQPICNLRGRTIAYEFN